MQEPTKPQSRKQAIFIHRYLDEMKLKPLEFRVYCHLHRRENRGKAWPGIRSIAKVCMIDKTSVAPAIAGLVKRRMVRIEKGSRNSNIYILTEPGEWVEIPDSQQSSLSGKSSSTVRNFHPLTDRNFTTQGKPLRQTKKSLQRGKEKSSIPTLEEVKVFAPEIGVSEIESERFFNYYSGIGWMKSGTPISNWRAIFRNWRPAANAGNGAAKRQAEREKPDPDGWREFLKSIGRPYREFRFSMPHVRDDFKAARALPGNGKTI